MAKDVEEAVIQHSVWDVIQILENEPVQPDLIGAITAAQIMNRASIAHLSIERAMKFLTTRAGGPLIEIHDLSKQLRELKRHAPESEAFLGHAFDVAVRHYRFNTNADNARHLKSLQSYLEVAGSKKAFDDLRYWELSQSRDELVLRRVNLTLHMELLHAVYELLTRRKPTNIVVSRVERAVREVMWRDSELAYSPGTAKEDSVHSYLKWLSGFASVTEALAEAARQGFTIGDEFANRMVIRAHEALLKSPDQAVFYYADTLVVLPKQPRDLVPEVEWIGNPTRQTGFVRAPSGVLLGEIARRWDGLWTITPFHSGHAAVKARSQTDAQCHLASLFVPLAQLTVNGEVRHLRIVANEETLYTWKQAQFGEPADSLTGRDGHPIDVTFWDTDHGLTPDDVIRIKVVLKPESSLANVLQGVVTNAAEHVVHLVGNAWFGMAAGGSISSGAVRYTGLG